MSNTLGDRLNQLEAVIFDKLNVEINFLKAILTILNNFHNNKNLIDTRLTIETIFGENKLKSSVWYELIKGEDSIFTTDSTRLLAKLVENLHNHAHKDVIIKVFDKFNDTASTTTSIFNFNFILNVLQQIGADIFLSCHSVDAATSQKNKLLVDCVDNFKLDNVYFNRIVLADWLDNCNTPGNNTLSKFHGLSNDLRF